MTTIMNGNAPELKDLIPAPKQTRQYWHCWSSPEAFAAYCLKIERSTAWHSCGWSDENSKWRGSDSLDAACNLARDGWQEGAEKASRIRDKINAANPQGPRLVKYDVAGAYPSVARALAGNPLNMRRFDSAKLRKRPIITLVSNACVSASVDADALLNRAAVVAAIVDSIEAAGFSCQVVTAVISNQGDLVTPIFITVKEASAQADIARLAFGLGHPSLLRRMCFAAWSENEFTKALGSMMGWVQKPNIGKGENAAMTFMLESADNDKFTRETTAETTGLAYLVKSLTDQGCPAFPADTSQQGYAA